MRITTAANGKGWMMRLRDMTVKDSWFKRARRDDLDDLFWFLMAKFGAGALVEILPDGSRRYTHDKT